MSNGANDEPPPPQRTATYPLSRLSARIELVDTAKEIERADAMLGAVVGSQLELIAEQIRRLQDDARRILEQAHRDVDLHRARCDFHRRPGKVYHLYRRPDGEAYFSMLSPGDWKGAPPHPFVGSFRLGPDMRWTPVVEGDERDDGEVTPPR